MLLCDETILDFFLSVFFNKFFYLNSALWHFAAKTRCGLDICLTDGPLVCLPDSVDAQKADTKLGFDSLKLSIKKKRGASLEKQFFTFFLFHSCLIDLD